MLKNEERPKTSARTCRGCRQPLPADADPRRRHCGPACRQAAYRCRVRKGTAGEFRTVENVADRLLAEAIPEGDCRLAASTTTAGHPARTVVTLPDGPRPVGAATVVYMANVDPDCPPSAATWTTCGHPDCLTPAHLRRRG